MYKAFQSPRSGKFESNAHEEGGNEYRWVTFQSPRSGKFESNMVLGICVGGFAKEFQSPRSGNLNQIGC